MYAAIIKQQYDDSGETEIYKPSVGANESVYAELRKAYIIRRGATSDFVSFLLESYEAWINEHLHHP